MTESEWSVSADPAAMVRFYTSDDAPLHPPRSDRKLRLFACACLRVSWCGLTGEGSRANVELAERIADGGSPPIPTLLDDPASPDHMAICGEDAHAAAVYGAMYAGNLFTDRPTQAALLRDIIGNPFRPPYVVTRSLEGWLYKPDGRRVSIGEAGEVTLVDMDWLTPAVLSLAQAAYEERLEGGHLNPVRLAILADALEEAGCVDPPRPMAWLPTQGLLAHLRSPGPHVRGCWAVDLLTGFACHNLHPCRSIQA